MRWSALNELYRSLNIPRYLRDLRVRQQCHATGMVRTIDDHFVEAETLNAAQVLEVARGRNVGGQRGKLCWGSPAPKLARIYRKPDHLWRSFALVPQAKWTSVQKRHDTLHCAMRGQLLRPSGPLGGDHDPLLGEEILS